MVTNNGDSKEPTAKEVLKEKYAALLTAVADYVIGVVTAKPDSSLGVDELSFLGGQIDGVVGTMRNIEDALRNLGTKGY